ncbi:methylenetetrahydrofolate--tRNA-(uracil(54)-C(5))-methyltransferase (FADH(2)-oxidizing) TrmFO [Sphingomonas histidinilytica]|jgi:methylenetetrahydrofolate--tRNA-(uracil-5-)-methyltransferase|uniref:Methylenetetrahydrofolate--tRNA-(uracil-5-)-methyltransferase TrmFO n=1 Tax=Rhizorhabdus histidinilytica TaxID=439228 RepID=A0A1T5GDV0_9SPHN|nr:methylenetetrahydrofolate--tRNA-(uracil(54)-C(5))-methyltransferase (FADH(2)-oxidizing) TrmFO [Rhizorhabdus histidinilytica]MBO9379150.1 methylenetetrahydrofolate--tRNA-(uracil(54)-C(5))-methyltransferase (FADH(2)-oxidizing) TrmFO [Rhizorhabdus histidinilytica]QEH77657.1 methylenetetrahydrofolate--tRNA-(uracil(54)-C(5))-methyltransferase (FADH(2)-oxidizing) TrmFO [Sphingomonas sp. C8-2]SKC06605.1 methylenetetrahydrofolate--tRNA-(uracil-5-)-methyltransferase [Rhizorhabdus histidinilytica]
MVHQIHVIGGGLAGSEAAWQLAQAGIRVRLSEMRGVEATPAHQTDSLAELVCSNSFRSDDPANAVGLLHAEMRSLGSLIMAKADAHRVPAGSALAVDREGYAEAVTRAVADHPLIELVRERVDALPADGPAIVATGPLTAAALADSIGAATGADALAFFDAIAPIVHHHSIDMDVAWMASRWDKGETKDYINCPMDKEQYLAFHQALLDGEKTAFKEWEKDTPYFDGCMPIEVMAERGVDTLRYGPMKPVGLDNPRTGRWPYAVVQLRQDNALGTLWNMVGFQTKLKHAEQVRLFRTIPGLEKAEFARLGGLHRNTFIQSPKLLDGTLRLKSRPNIRFAGQITGCEGYVESAAIGLLAGRFAAAELLGRPIETPPAVTALGALLGHITGGAEADGYQPMNVNFGLFPPLEGAKSGRKRKGDRKAMMAERAGEALKAWMEGGVELA